MNREKVEATLAIGAFIAFLVYFKEIMAFFGKVLSVLVQAGIAGFCVVLVIALLGLIVSAFEENNRKPGEPTWDFASGH